MKRTRSSWLVFARHQLAALAATTVDFSTMVLLVERLRARPAVAALAGAAVGAILNFLLNRRVTFGATGDTVPSQAARYALVSATSAVLNSLGEYVGTSLLRAPYVPVRMVVACMVGLGWNFPMHRSFVFRHVGERT